MVHVLPYLAFDTTIIAGLVVWNTVLIYFMVTNLHMNDFGKFYYSVLRCGKVDIGTL